jgi:hypothetical protein
MESLFDLVGGLPVHPLVIHAVSVLVPLSALGLIVAVFSKSFRNRFAVALVVLLAVTVPLAFVAKESGEALAGRVGITEQHESLGEVFPIWVTVLFVVAVVWVFVARRDGSVLVRRIVGGVLIFTTAQLIVLTVLVGHSGAQATWANIIGGGGTPTATETATPSPSAPSEPAFTMDEVSQHASATDCWTVVNGNVYDVTPFVNRHPGGTAAIEMLCGGDGTSMFDRQHGSAPAPNAELDALKIGTVATP